MNGRKLLPWPVSVIADFSNPLAWFALIMRIVGRIAPRDLIVILAVDAVFWAMAAFF
ncbi:hypothetical protein P12x_000465 [Tundrisphaera lichenicola]|uniref:hypothetical protein n=1 Tax=Tundrisphaera lichenicola TaxID=2029860 RepID=UPI003EB76AE3